MRDERSEAIRTRFHLRDGQFFGAYKYKNLHWFLNGEEFGFGDLRPKDILLIAAAIEPGEVFEGFNEHHMTLHMQCENPMVRIDCNSVTYPDRIPVSEESWKKIEERYGKKGQTCPHCQGTTIPGGKKSTVPNN